MTPLDVGRAAWPAIDLAPEVFRRHLAARAIDPDENCDGDGEALHAGELYLACACLESIPTALDAFDRAFLSRVPQLVAKLKPTPAFVDELKQLLRAKLFVGPSPKLAEFSGRGPLIAWLRVVAVRAAIDLKRTRGEQPRPSLDEVALPVDPRTPELEALRRRYRPLFQEAFRAAFATLDQEERALLKLHYVEGMSMEEVAKLYKVGRSTAFRRLNACTAALEESIRARMKSELGLSTEEFDSLAGAVRSDLDLSLGGLLKTKG